MKLHDNIRTTKTYKFYWDRQDIEESLWPSFFYLITVWVTYVFWTQPSDSLTGTLECTCSFNTLRTKDLETIWQPVSGKAACPPVHPPLPVNRITPVYLFMISFFPPPLPLLCWEHCVILGCKSSTRLVITGSWFIGLKSIKSKDNVNSQHQPGVIHVTTVNSCFFCSSVSDFSLFSHLSHFCSDSIFEGPCVKLPAVLIPGITHCTYSWLLSERLGPFDNTPGKTYYFCRFTLKCIIYSVAGENRERTKTTSHFHTLKMKLYWLFHTLYEDVFWTTVVQILHRQLKRLYLWTNLKWTSLSN